MNQCTSEGGPRSRPAESEQLAVAGSLERLLHHVDVRRADAARDGNVVVCNPGAGCRFLYVAGGGLVRFLAVGAIVDQHGYALLRQPGDFLYSDLAADQSAIVELADHQALTSPNRRLNQ